MMMYSSGFLLKKGFNMKRKIFWMAGCIALMNLIGCGTNEVVCTYEPSTDFASLKTYAWQDFDNSSLEDSGLDVDMIDQRIRQAVDTQLAARGVVPADQANADCWIVYSLSVEREFYNTSISETNVGRAGRLGWSRMSRDPAYISRYETVYHEYNEGTLVVYVIDPATEKPVWQALLEAVVDPSNSVEERRKRIDKAITALFSLFPPP